MLTTRKKPSSIANERVTQSSPNRIISKVQFVHNNKVKKYNEKTESVGSIPTTYHCQPAMIMMSVTHLVFWLHQLETKSLLKSLIVSIYVQAS